jgi:foldase protein PrsA
MKQKKFLSALAAAGLAVMCAFGVTACSSSQSSSTGGVAATVNGVEIPEDEVTNMIESIRSQAGLTDADKWGQWLANNNMTPESVRSEMIDSFVEEELIKEGAADRGLSVDSATVDSYVDSIKSNYGSDGDWQNALSQAGFTEDRYRDTIETSLLQQQMLASFADEVSVDDDTMNQYASTFASYYNGAKRSSHILFSADDTDTAQSVLDQRNAGTLDWDTAVQQYSTDTASAANNGDVGWDKLNSFVTEYTNALANLDKGQTSGLVTSQYGIHIIRCTDVFDGSDVTTYDQLPQEFQDSLRTMLTSSAEQTAFSNWLQQAEQSADIVKNDMPSGLPYSVDMSKYSASSSSAATAATTTSSSSASSAASSSASSDASASSSSSSASTN